MCATISDTTGLDARSLARVSIKSGLTIRTCEELLKRGWTYIEGFGGPPRWELIPLAGFPRTTPNHTHTKL